MTTCITCTHDDPHTGGGIGVCRHAGCGCDGPCTQEDKEAIENDPGKFRFASVMGVGDRCLFFPRLYDAARNDYHAADHGDDWSEGVFELTADGWVQVDISDLIERFRREEEEQSAAASANFVALPWRLWVWGPGDRAVWWSSHESEDAARDAATKLPRWLDWRVGTTTHPPHRYAPRP